MHKRNEKMGASHQRLWWMEITRGTLTVAFSLLFLTTRSFAPHLFIYSLGVFFVIDGVLELYSVHRKKRVSPALHTIFDDVEGATGLLVGLGCLVFPGLALLFLAYVIAVCILVNSFSHMRAARRTRRGTTSYFLGWATVLFLLMGLFIVLFPLFVITFLVAFLSIYMLIAGLFLLLRGLSLRFPSSGLPTVTSQPSYAPPSLRSERAPSTRRAVVFVRRTSAEGLGHIAWAFEWMNGWFNVGSVENFKSIPFANPQDMDFWCMHTLDPVATMERQERSYDEYKLFFVTQPHPKDAWNTVVWESHQPYSFVHHNCCDVTYEVLRTYGCTEILDPAWESIPNDWYDALPGISYAVTSSVAIPARLPRQSQRDSAIHEIALSIPSRMQGTPPPWLKHRWRAWEELNLMWEMMVGHVQTVCISSKTLVTQWLRHTVLHL